MLTTLNIALLIANILWLYGTGCAFHRVLKLQRLFALLCMQSLKVSNWPMIKVMESSLPPDHAIQVSINAVRVSGED